MLGTLDILYMLGPEKKANEMRAKEADEEMSCGAMRWDAYSFSQIIQLINTNYGR